ncbi:hypothetical protein BDB00DRAFT_332569 [Zychaea mexicana]|uniref:uncharacterized protein n=1 Tax=Zychaea mexicana TaxID=64656 RepID=UPI0022FDBE5E|nr:uncharacterized protein BDB00DRAFT_332569 [Zychaea mexicana]KAI9499062.1 hypothetical protein BDB00DRAFT_332569 [Zychaea mexicana]
MSIPFFRARLAPNASNFCRTSCRSSTVNASRPRRNFAASPPEIHRQQFGGNDNYQRFQSSRPPFYLSRRFWVTAGTGTVLFGGYYVMHLETVPVSGRKRFMDVSPRLEEGKIIIVICAAIYAFFS